MTDRRVYEGGYNTYGSGLGVLMLDTDFPRPPGDVGNARTFDYPVFYEVVDDASPIRVVREQDSELLRPFVRSARSLVDRGAVAITTGCGFLLPFQNELAEAVPEVPVYTSSLLQIPLVAASLPASKQIGVLSADEETIGRLDHPVLSEYEDRLVTDGLAGSDAFQEVIIEMSHDELDLDEVGADVLRAARRLTDAANVGALIFECTNLRPYVDLVQEETGLPVYDYLTLADMAWRAASGTRF